MFKIHLGTVLYKLWNLIKFCFACLLIDSGQNCSLKMRLLYSREKTWLSQRLFEIPMFLRFLCHVAASILPISMDRSFLDLF